MESPGYRFTSHCICTKMALTPPLKVQEVTPASHSREQKEVLLLV